MDSDEQRKSESGILGEAANGQAAVVRRKRFYPTREKMIVTHNGQRFEVGGEADGDGRRVVVVHLPAGAVVTYEKL
jgi:hypothetical protein